MASLHQKLNTLDGIRMTESDDDVESYWEIGTKLISTARHILQSGLLSTISCAEKNNYKNSLTNVICLQVEI